MPVKTFYHISNKHVPSHVTVDMGNQELNKVGANLSARFPLGVKSENGNIVYGFFTQNSYVRKSRELFDERFNPTLNNPKKKKYEDIYKIFLSDMQTNGLYNSSLQWYSMIKITPNMLAGNVGKIDGREIIHYINSKAKQNIDAKNDILNYLVSKGVDKDFLNGEMGKSGFWNYVGDMLTAAHSAGFLTTAHIGTHKIAYGENINKRNNAMYDLASLIGEENIVCKSSSMTVISNGKQIDGSFMINAIGTDRTKWDPRSPEMNGRPVVISADAVKSISKLQILDFLCANVDRHPDNMFYQLDTHSDPQHVRLTGVQGIDNDASFGNILSRSAKNPNALGAGYLSYINDIKVIDKSVAEMVLKLSTEALDEKIRLAGLSAEEIEAAHNRLSALQSKINSGAIEILDGDEWKKYEDPQQFQRLRNADPVSHTFNIFDNAAFACEEYNKKINRVLRNNAEVKRPSQQPPVGLAKDVFENNIVDVHKNEIEHILKGLSEPAFVKSSDKALNVPAGFDSLCNDIKELSVYMNSLSEDIRQKMDQEVNAGKDVVSFTLTDMQRNMLLVRMKSLKRAVDEFAVNGSAGELVDKDGNKVHSGYTKKLVNGVKNLSAYLNFASQSIREDAIEAEKNLASKMSYDIAKNAGLINGNILFVDRPEMNREYTTTHTLESLRTEFENVDKWYKKSSSQFKEMQEELFNFDISKAKNNMDRQIMYNKLIDKAQKYIDYKTPDGKRDGLNDYSRKRVEFAEKIVEFGKAAKSQVNKNEKKRAAESDMAEKDIRELVKINNKYTPMIKKYMTSKDGYGSEEWTKNLKALWDVREDYAKDFKTILNMSDKYPVDHEMQIAFNKVLSDENMGLYTGIVLLGAQKFSDDPKLQSANSGLEVLGMEFDDVHKLEQLSHKAEAAQKKYKLAHPKQAQKPEAAEQLVNDEPKFPGLF